MVLNFIEWLCYKSKSNVLATIASFDYSVPHHPENER